MRQMRTPARMRSWAAALWAIAAMAMAWAVSAAPAPVMVLEAHGIVNPAMSDFIVRGLERARADKAQLAVIELDTPGGLDTSMRSILRAILASDVPVATFVAPAGARAASAGTFILYGSHIAAMAPGTNVGAATPVNLGGSGPGSREPGTAKSNGSGDAKAPETQGSGSDAMHRKVTNDAAAYIRSLAQLRGRNGDFAERAVRDAVSLSAQDALQQNVIDLVVPDIDTLLAKLDGRQVTLREGLSVTLHTKGAAVERLVPDWRTRLLSVIADPQVALLLMMVGIYGLFFELMSPGVALPGVAGLICLLLAAYAFQMLPVNWAGVALVAAGAAMMVAEMFFPTFGALGLGGLVAFVLGGLFLTDTGIPGFDVSLPFLLGLAAVSAVLLMTIAGMALKAHRHKVVSGREQMIGLPGVVRHAVAGRIYADVHGERWEVRCDQPLAPGDPVTVTGMEGLTLIVQRRASAQEVQGGSTHVL